MVLVLVLVVVALLTLACFTFSELMLTERKAADLAARRAKARAIADSGIEAARLFLSQEPALQLDAGGCYDNQQQFRGVIVTGDEQGGNLGRFTIIAPSAGYGAVEGLRYGLEDESSRLNLNTLFSVGKDESSSPDQQALLDTFLGSESGDDSAGAAERNLLMGLPSMTEDIADAILDWIDPDDETRQFGAESDYYTSLASPYAPKNGPLETIEELLLVRGVTPELLLGTDANRNAMVESYESAGVGMVDSADGSLDRGWAAYLTLYSAETNKRLDGSDKIDLNQSDMEQLYAELEENLQNSQWAAFIIALRQYGPYEGNSIESSPYTPTTTTGLYTPGVTRTYPAPSTDTNPSLYYPSPQRGGGGGGGGGGGNEDEERVTPDPGSRNGPDTSRDELQDPSDSPEDTATEDIPSEPFPDDFQLDLSQGAKEEITSVLDLIGAEIEVEVDDGGGEKKKIVYRSPFSDEPGEIGAYLPILMETLATDTSKKIAGRININEASPAVLQGIPGMTPEAVNQILTRRNPDPLQADATRRHATWILSEGIVALDEMKQLFPYVTGAGSVHRVQSVGYFDRGGPAVRVEAVLDATASPVRLRHFRDLSHLGRGYALETLGIE